ncbi:Rieske (2Fe-2S) protein [Aspergillus stella-maris]|uniref:Rieske (2Fe-2S) protein n=1 Tax=Aspergillus stella-maris TaxID=1810926 RepID=UPI003CCCDD69
MNDSNPSIPTEKEEWHFVGPISSFPDIQLEGNESGSQVRPGCKTLLIPKSEKLTSKSTRSNLDEQVLIFKYKGSIHAIDNKCPHSSFPLREGKILDIEDAGASIRCFRHGWTFELGSGVKVGERAGATSGLGLWDVEIRDSGSESGSEEEKMEEKEVWVRRRRQNGV